MNLQNDSELKIRRNRESINAYGVKIAYKEYFTLDDYDAKLDLEKELDELEIGAGEETLQSQRVLECALWLAH